MATDDTGKVIKAYALTTSKHIPVLTCAYLAISRTYGNYATAMTKPHVVAARVKRKKMVMEA